tara:strand:+ start:7676 stop:8317 length:642 start_codon:yes stop_codon:yes gene_type:complete
MVGAAAVTAVSSGVALHKANQQKKDAKDMVDEQQRAIDDLKEAREAVPDYSAEFEDMASQVSNPFANLSVATKAAEMQAEQADIALANTLDTIKATGAGAGGATALAQAALRSKQGISANIEQQEAQNQKLQAQGEQQAQAQRFSLLGQAVQADQAEFAIKEGRNEMDLDAAASLQDRALANQYAAEAGQLQALGNLASAGSSALTAGIGAAP